MPRASEETRKRFMRRAAYVQKRINNARSTEAEVRKLQKELFLSRSQIYSDLKVDLRKGPGR